MRIILGSQSPRRLEILKAAMPPGTLIEVMPADIDEKSIRHTSPSVLTLTIARAKNEALRPRVQGDAVIVTADTVAVYDQCIREKPRDDGELRYFVKTYSGYRTDAVTSVWVHRTGTGWSGSAVDKAVVEFGHFPREQVERIVADEAFYASAGGFLIEHPLMRDYIRAIRGNPETVDGLPGRITGLLVADALAS